MVELKLILQSLTVLLDRIRKEKATPLLPQVGRDVSAFEACFLLSQLLLFLEVIFL